MRPRRLLTRLEAGEPHNIRFGDFQRLLEALGFELDRVRGDHYLYRHPITGIRINVQPLRNGDAKPYQLRQLLGHVRKYALKLEG